MRRFLLTIFWISAIGNVFQLLIMVTAAWFILSGSYAFLDLTLEVFVTQVAPWLSWVKTFIVSLFGELGNFILSIPIFVLSPLKFIAGLLIGWWAYSTAKKMPIEAAYA